MSIDVDSLGLATQGAALAAEQMPLAPEPVTPPGNDPVSMYAVAVLSTQWLRLSLVCAHGSLQKAVGGLAVTATGTGFELQDKFNIGLFDQLGKLGELAQMASGVQSPNLPDLLALPTVPPPPTIPPQVFSELLFAGPGGSAVRDQSGALRGQIATMRQDADQAAAAGAGIDGAWQDGGNQQAGANTARWGAWKGDVADDAETLAKSLDSFADANDRARQSTPTPDEYQQAYNDLSMAMSSGNPVAAAQAAAHISDLNGRGGEAMTAYYGDVASLTAALTGDLKTAPAIAGGHGDSGGDQQGSGQHGGSTKSGQGSTEGGSSQQPGGQSGGSGAESLSSAPAGQNTGPGQQPGGGSGQWQDVVQPGVQEPPPSGAKTWQDMMGVGAQPSGAPSVDSLLNPAGNPAAAAQDPNPMSMFTSPTDPLRNLIGPSGPPAPAAPVAEGSDYLSQLGDRLTKVGTKTGEGCFVGGTAAGIGSLILPPSEVVTVPVGCITGAIGGGLAEIVSPSK
jgi:hypothetical protein